MTYTVFAVCRALIACTALVILIVVLRENHGTK
jgi:hypothetical protein